MAQHTQLMNLGRELVACYDLGRAFTAKELLWIEYLRQSSVENLQNRISSSSSVLLTEPLIALGQWCQQCCDDYAHRVQQLMEGVRVEITESWINYTAPGEQHHRHSHANSWLSGTVYTHSEEGDCIEFWPMDHYHRHWNVFAATSPWVTAQRIPVRAGTLLIWPSTMEHSTPLRKAQRSRISISFNSWLRGNLGTSSSRTLLKID